MRLRNPFINRITRHKAVATLFRAPDTNAQTVQASQANAPAPLMQSSRQIPVAALLPQSRLDTLPQGSVLGAPLPPEFPEPPQTQVDLQDLIQRAERPAVQRTPAQQPPVRPQAQRQAEAVRAAERPPTSRPSAQAAPESMEADWPRLQNIFRKHEESEPAGDTAEIETTGEVEQPRDAAETPARTTGTPAHIQRQAESTPRQMRTPGPPPSRKPIITEIDPSSGKPVPEPARPLTSPEREEEPALPQVQEEQPIPEAQEVEESASAQLETPAESPVDDVVLQRASEAPTQVSQPSESAPAIAAEPASTSELEPSEPQEIADRKPAEADTPLPTQTIQRSQERTDISTGSPQTQEEMGEAPVTEAGALIETPAEDAQQVPLEAAWPVQRSEPSTQPHAVQRHPDAVDQAQTEISDEEVQQVENVLNGIAVEQATDSHVELITPRKPRPRALQRTKAPTAQDQPAADTQDTFSEAPVSQPAASPKAVMQKMPAETEVVESASSPSDSVQRASLPDQAAPAEPGAGPQYIETEIGPLPADLWQLMGEQPPVQSDAASPAHTASAISAAESSIQRSVENEPAAQEAKAVLQRQVTTEMPSVVQREDAGSATQAESASGEQSAEGEEDAGEEGKVDTDELARKVYAQIKRRLSVEWERLRRRF